MLLKVWVMCAFISSFCWIYDFWRSVRRFKISHHSVSSKRLVLDQGLLNSSKTINLLNVIHLSTPVYVWGGRERQTDRQTYTLSHMEQRLTQFLEWEKGLLSSGRSSSSLIYQPFTMRPALAPDLSLMTEDTHFQHKGPLISTPPKTQRLASNIGNFKIWEKNSWFCLLNSMSPP